jgi:hypothetical protein
MKKTLQPHQARFFLVTVLLLALSAQACAISQVTFRRNSEVNAAFEAGRVLPEYQYYYSGPDAEPLAIVGIRREHRFEQGLWKGVALSEAQLRDWVWMIDTATRSTRLRYYGAQILAPDGREIGIWYSFLDWVTAEVTPKGLVILHTPDNTDSRRMRRFFDTE